MNTQSDAPWKGQLPLHFCFLLATNFFKWAGRQLWENASKNYSHLFFILKFKLQKVLGEGGKERLSWMGMCVYIYIYIHVHHLCCLWWWYSHSATENAFLHALSCFLLYLNLPHSIPSIQWPAKFCLKRYLFFYSTNSVRHGRCLKISGTSAFREPTPATTTTQTSKKGLLRTQKQVWASVQCLALPTCIFYFCILEACLCSVLLLFLAFLLVYHK